MNREMKELMAKKSLEFCSKYKDKEWASINSYLSGFMAGYEAAKDEPKATEFKTQVMATIKNGDPN